VNLQQRSPAAADKYQRSLDIEKGELVRFVWMQTPDTEGMNRLLLVVHHLAVDGVSWRILLEDLELMLGGLMSGGKTDLGPKSASYRQWYEALEAYGQSAELLSQRSYWTKTANNYKALPVDQSFEGLVRVKDTAHHSSKLGMSATRSLLQEVPKVYHTQINDLLLAALAGTLCGWSKNDHITIGLEGHGREEIAGGGIDTLRTVGWFTTHYPVLLETGGGAGIDALIKSVKEQLRQIPDRGLGYGVLKYINKEESLQGRDPWDIIFNYLGQLDNVVGQGKWLSAGAEPAGASRSGEHVLRDKLVINALVQEGELVLSWSYSTKHYNQQTIQTLAENYIAMLEQLILHCSSQPAEIFTPSDYGLGALVSYQELDAFLAEDYKGKPRKEQVAGLYPLSGLQKGMLFHGLYNGSAGDYTEQLACDLTGVKVDLIIKSWEQLIQRHSILRSGFYYDVFDVPVQVVYREASMPVNLLDYREMNPGQQTAAVNDYEAQDRVKGFDFKTAPLMRLGLLRLSEERYRMIWTWNHILVDGWSMPILMEAFLSSYASLAGGREPLIKPEDRYEDYIRYLERLDKRKQHAYWTWLHGRTGAKHAIAIYQQQQRAHEGNG
jgi:non-ribosomal peptide synthase protein (TIGR01720 family)